MRRKTRRKLALGMIIAALVIWSKRPGDDGHSGVLTPDDAYFSALNPLIKRECNGLPCAVIDLDRLDANIQLIKSRIRLPHRLRVVVKSLPSLELIRYILEKTGTRNVMVFHAPHIGALLREFGELDLLTGKPMPAAAARQALLETPAAAEHVQWLVDTQERLAEYLKVARELKTKLKISLEIDVGLHRGGSRDGAELLTMLTRIRENPAQLSFSGLMGYDGHVSHAPAILGWGDKSRAMHGAFDEMLRTYSEFVRQGKAFDPTWFENAKVTLNGGGSHTYAYYEAAETPINDISLGSAFVKPADFEDESLSQHQRAVFLAIPILKKLTTVSVPLMDAVWSLAIAWDPNAAVGFYLYGSLWDAPILAPRGLRAGWFYPPDIRNLLPNQSLVSGSVSVKADIGDYVWLQPREGDGIAVFEQIIAVRGGKAESRWKPLQTLN